MTEWQPIETAPKDGTPILLARKEYIDIGLWDHTHICRQGAAPGSWMSGFDGSGPDGPEDDYWPTHWMPLPQPPKG